MRIAAIVLLASLMGSAHAGIRVPVKIDAESPDKVGKMVVAVLKGKVAESDVLMLEPDAGLRLELGILTMDQLDAHPGAATVVSVVLNIKRPGSDSLYNLEHSLGYCGADRIDYCVDNIFGMLESKANELIEAVNKKLDDPQS